MAGGIYEPVGREEARWVIAWQTKNMPAPAFVYFADPVIASNYAKLCAVEGRLVYFKPVKEG